MQTYDYLAYGIEPFLVGGSGISNMEFALVASLAAVVGMIALLALGHRS